jgi:hypothetical protein
MTKNKSSFSGDIRTSTDTVSRQAVAPAILFDNVSKRVSVAKAIRPPGRMTLTHRMLQAEPLDYEALVEEYNKNLYLAPRGHRSADYPDAWDPDENPLKARR